MNFKFMGISDEITTCDCCGKSNLKKTVVLSVEGEIVHYGTTCASRKLGKAAGKEVNNQADSMQKINQLFALWNGKFSTKEIVEGLWNRTGLAFAVKNEQVVYFPNRKAHEYIILNTGEYVELPAPAPISKPKRQLRSLGQ